MLIVKAVLLQGRPAKVVQQIHWSTHISPTSWCLADASMKAAFHASARSLPSLVGTDLCRMGATNKSPG